MPTSACCASAKPSANDSSPWQTLETPTETGSASSPWTRRSRSRNALARGRREPHERAKRVLAVVEERARRRGSERARERVAPGLRDEDDVRLVEVAAEPRRAPFEVASRATAGELLEEVLDEVLLRELLDDLHLLDPHRDLARDRAAELDARAALGDEQADQLAVRDERDGESRAPASARELRAELGEPERLTCRSRLGVARDPVELLARRIEQIDVAGARGEQRARVRGDRLRRARRARPRARSPPRAR